MTELSSNVAIVTGAAGGMGSAIAIEFARTGYPLILCDLRQEAIEASANALPEGHPVTIVAGDITAPDYLGKLVAALGSRKIGALAHAAGVSPSMTDGKRIYEINFTATQRLIEALFPHMAEGGSAVLIASMAGQMIARPLFDRAFKAKMRGASSLIANLMLRSPRTAYPMSKRAVQLYAEAMAPAFGKLGARINSLSPGMIDTEMGRLENIAGPEMAKMVAVTPLARMGRSAEIASAVAFLASPAASYISGTDLLVDGGTVAGVAAIGGPTKL